jgi:lysophospholipase L1-like esterase
VQTALITRSSPVVKFAVIGDSAAYGTGDQAADGTHRGWAYYLSESFQWDIDYLNFSRPGAKSDEVASTQLQLVKNLELDICAVIAGGNDLLRNGFNPKDLYKNLRSTCDELMAKGTEVIMFELHDPNRLLRIPRLLKRVLRRRVEAVNEVYQQIANELDVVLIKTREIPDVHNLQNWHIDRMHPGPRGHNLLAREMAAILQGRGWPVDLPIPAQIVESSSGKKFIWLLRNGLPWFLKRSVDLVPAAIYLMVLEIIKITCSAIKEQGRRIRR